MITRVAQFVPEEIPREMLDRARSLATPELLGDGVFAGSVDEVVEEVEALVGAGLRHVVIWNLSPLVSGAGPRGMLQLAKLIRRLKRSSCPDLTKESPSVGEVRRTAVRA